MNKRQVLLRRIRLVVAFLMIIAPFIVTTAQDVPRNKTLIIGFEGGPPSSAENFGLNPTALNSQGVHQVMIKSAYVLNYQTGEAVPWLATGPEKWNADYSEFDIPLRAGIEWNDGVPAADDVVFSLNMYKEHSDLRGATNGLAADPDSKATFLDNGAAPALYSVIRNPALAKALRLHSGAGRGRVLSRRHRRSDRRQGDG